MADIVVLDDVYSENLDDLSDKCDYKAIREKNDRDRLDEEEECEVIDEVVISPVISREKRKSMRTLRATKVFPVVI